MADQTNKFFYPVTPETLHQYAASIFAPICRGECVTTVWVPMAGRRMWNKFIIENIPLFAKELPNYQKYLLVYIEPLDLNEESLIGYLRLMGKSIIEACQQHEGCGKLFDTKIDILKIFDDESASYARLLGGLKNYIQQLTSNGYGVVLFLGEFDELSFTSSVFYNNLKSLWSQFAPKLHYIFLMRGEVTSPKKIANWGDFSEVVLQNIVYIPISNQTDSDYILARIRDSLDVDLSAENKQVIRRLCGGHPYMLRIALKVLAKQDGHKFSPDEFERLLFEHYELQSVAGGILEVQNGNAKAVLNKIIGGKELSSSDKDPLELLKNLGIICASGDGHFQVFGEIFKRALRETGPGLSSGISRQNSSLSIDAETEAIILNGQTVEEKFTRQEYTLLAMFLQKANKLCSRDNVGEALWGKDSYEKYSDWAIDQIMSKLRRKLKALGATEKILTIRGQGYKLVASSA